MSKTVKKRFECKKHLWWRELSLIPRGVDLSSQRRNIFLILNWANFVVEVMKQVR